MAIKVIYLQVAVQDLVSIYKFISQDSVKYAKLEVQKIKAFSESLKHQPLKGKFYRTTSDKDILSIVFKHYIIFYIIDDELISILSIHHHARLILTTRLLRMKNNLSPSFTNFTPQIKTRIKNYP